MEVMDIDNEYFMVKFDHSDDRERALCGGPWMLFDHYIGVRRWSPNFHSSDAKIDRTLVWIRLPRLNLAFYDEQVLLRLASTVGIPIKVDNYTTSVARGKFPRVCEY